jgi:hypothetical protein
MHRAFSGAMLGVLLLTLTLRAQQGIQQGKIKKVDPDKSVLTITVDGQDRDFLLTPGTRVMGADGKQTEPDLKDPRFRTGTAVMLKAVERDGKNFLLGLRLGGRGQPPPLVRVDTSRLKPLPELGKGEYQGFRGGLYPDGQNKRPAGHEAAGVALAKKVRPLDAEGKPSPDGKIVLLSVGMSNTTQVFSAFKALADADTDKNRRLVIVDGAQGGMSAGRIVDPGDNDTPVKEKADQQQQQLETKPQPAWSSGKRFWWEVDRRLRAAGVSRAQVQAVWIKQADPGPRQGFPGYARTLQDELGKIVRVLHARFPNLKQVYLSSRTYGGYARTPLNPEPYAYESGFSVKWLIEQQLKGEPALNYDAAKGPVRAPWLSWGPYLWANGTAKTGYDLFYEQSDFAGDGTHPSRAGQQKVARALLQFFKTDTTTRLWFVAQ